MFKKAKPIWIKNKSTVKNVFAVFRVKTQFLQDAELHLIGATYYRVYINGSFAGFGPARAPFGYAREDIFPLKLQSDTNKTEYEIVIEAAGYYCHSLSTVWQPSFIMAEVQSEGEVLAYTGRDFEAFEPSCKIQKVERYSHQRHFCEVWDYRDFTSITDDVYRAEIEILSDTLQIIDRVAPYPLYEDVELSQARIKGYLTYDETLPYKRERYSTPISERWGKFPYEEITCHPYTWVQRQRQTIQERQADFPLLLQKGDYIILDFARVEAGFFHFHLEVLEESDLVLSYSEYYQGNEFKVPNMNVHNVIEYFFSAGDTRSVQSFEPYTARFVMLAVKEGSVKLNSFGIKTFMFDISDVTYPEFGNEVIKSIYCAAVRTFAHNAVDLYSDCPSRERAGWLCDSYFTAKTEYSLTGSTKVEDAFLENYRLYKNRGEYPQGMLPMCYPSDEEDGAKYIPQWTMWYILEVADYVMRRGHEDMSEAFKKSIYDLLAFYRRYENEDGLLERLPSWNFVEWSSANSWTWDVNYPTNFLYAQVLESIADLYDDEECRRRSKEVRMTAAAQSFNGQYFMDHSIRNEKGELCLQSDSSEACQYYAVLFGGIDLNSDKYAYLKHLILEVFMPDRQGKMPEIMEVNAFIGAYLRIESLLKMEEYEVLLKNIEEFFGKMDEYTGTLWEYRQFNGSYDHGFASYALVAIKEAYRRK